MKHKHCSDFGSTLRATRLPLDRACNTAGITADGAGSCFAYSKLTLCLKFCHLMVGLVVQEPAVQQMRAQQARLDSLQWLLADARRLINAVSAVEGHAPTKTALQVGTH